MQFQNIQKIDPLTYTFRLSPIHVSYANTLRRLVITGVETVAFRADMTPTGTTSDVMIRQNDTPMTNEMLAHRIGLLPIHVKEPLKWNPDQYVFQLKATSSKDSVVNVMAGDFKVMERNSTLNELVDVDTARFFPLHPITRDTCLIATLAPNENQVIDITAKATMGTGRDNARFIPVSQCTYEYTRDSDPEKKKAYFQKWLLDAKKVMTDDLEEGSEKYKAYEREFNTMEVARCYLRDDKGEPYSFDFTIETLGILDVPYIVQRACEVGEAMVARYVSITTGELPNELTISPADSRVVGFDFLFRGHDHTLGNLLQTWLVQNHIEGTSQPRITFAGYKVPHPLRDEMVLRVGVEDGEEASARQAVAEACRGLVNMFRGLREAWIRANGGVPPAQKAVGLQRRGPASSMPTK